MKRRKFIKGTVATGSLAAAASTGLLQPQKALAANYPQAGFDAETNEATLNALFGDQTAADSANITLKAPEVAENGAVVPIKVTTSGPVEMIAIIVEENPSPLALAASFTSETNGYLSGRIKMGKTSNVVAYAKMNGEVIKTSVEVKVTAGGCGG